MERTNRLALALGLPLTLAAVLGGVAFAAGNSGAATGTSGTTSLFQQATPTPANDGSTPTTPATPTTPNDGTTPAPPGGNGSGSGCPGKNGTGSGSGSGSDTTNSGTSATNVNFRHGR